MPHDLEKDSVTAKSTITQHFDAAGRALPLKANESYDSLAAQMGAGWNRERTQAALRDIGVR